MASFKDILAAVQKKNHKKVKAIWLEDQLSTAEEKPSGMFTPAMPTQTPVLEMGGLDKRKGSRQLPTRNENHLASTFQTLQMRGPKMKTLNLGEVDALT